MVGFLIIDIVSLLVFCQYLQSFYSLHDFQNLSETA